MRLFTAAVPAPAITLDKAEVNWSQMTINGETAKAAQIREFEQQALCLLYTSDAADE